MMSKFTLIIVALCISLGPASVRADEIYTKEVEALQKVLFQKGVTDSTDDPRWRSSLAIALHRYCESVLAQVPRNTPEEDRWVDDEYQDIKASSANKLDPDHPLSFEQRISRIQNSVEAARKALRHLFSECSTISNKLLETKQASRRTEALLWVRLSRLFSFQQEPERLAEIIGLLRKNVCRPFNFVDLADILKGRADIPIDRNYLCSLESINAVITDHAVIPLLEGS
jgi:hypothetical protein